MPSLDVIGRKAVPDDVGRVAGDVVEDGRIDRHIVDEGKKADARPDACPDDADLFVTLLFQPSNGRAGVNDRLPQRLQCSSDVRSNEIIGPLKLGRHSLLVIRQRQAKGRKADLVEELAEVEIRARLCVPMRQDDDGRRSGWSRAESSSVGGVVFGDAVV